MKLLFTAFALLCCLQMFSQEKYSRLNIALNEKQSMQTLASLGLDVDHGRRGKSSFESDFSESEIQRLQQAGISFTVAIDDVQLYYLNRMVQADKKTRAVSCHPAIPTYTTPTAFNYGSMGSYLTLQEAYNELDSLAAAYPNLVTVKQAIGTYVTAENRPVYYVKISDNPNSNENEPQVLYNAAHHAREVVTVSQIIYFMQYLCENYASNQEVKRLVDNIEFYFVPVVNPDGYQYNYTTNPNGAGLWRKNRRNNGGGNYGVDLNRNYGLGWGYNNIGSSPTASSATYRGPSGFSEPETQAMRDFCNAHTFRFGVSYHSYSNLLIYPWGYLGKNCDDSVYFRALCEDLSQHNFYKSGTDLETVGYSTNGSSDDWMYGETLTKPLMYAFTPEVGDGNDGFWPAPNRIIPLCQESNFMNLTLAKYLLKYAQVEPVSSQLSATTNGFIRYSIQRLGMDTSGGFTVTLSGLTPNVTATGGANTHSNLVLGTTKIDSVAYTLQSGLTNGEMVKFVLSCNSGGITEYDTLTLYYGNVQTVYSNDASSQTGWSNNGFAIDNTTYLSAPGSIAENASGNYPNNFDAEIQTATFDLSQALHAELAYRCTWEIENSVDIVQVSISTNGSTFTPLCSQNTQPSADQTIVGEVYTGAVTDWKYEFINLDDYLGNSAVTLKWEFHSDAGLNMRGFNMDDVVVQKLSSIPMQLDALTNLPVQLYPIPAHDQITLSNANGMHYVIRNLCGQQVLSGHYSKPVSIANLPDGMYVVQLTSTNNSTINLKLVVHHP